MEPHIDKRTGVNFVIIRKSERGIEFIMQLRDEHSWQFAHHWCFPGGGRHPGESFKQTATREAFSETGVRIIEEKWIELCERPDYNPGFVLVTEVPYDTEVMCKEGAAMEWKTLEEFKVFVREGVIGYGHEEWLLPKLEAYIAKEYTSEQNRELKQALS